MGFGIKEVIEDATLNVLSKKMNIGCFPLNRSDVLTPSGLDRVHNLSEGLRVLSYDVGSQKVLEGSIRRVIHSSSDEFVKLQFDQGECNYYINNCNRSRSCNDSKSPDLCSWERLVFI